MTPDEITALHEFRWHEIVTEDKPIPEDAVIAAAHPMNTGRHDLYERAHRMVSAKHSKAALVDLVNWLLFEREVGGVVMD